ncbi:hypothetical protein KW785_00175 [Candidatus Parcubacteria bacterium]|nr:hypothetical protein [Candidatus Parcubacteria bacterium]
MRKYIETMKERPHSHKRAFALSVSGAVTLMIFAIWSFVHFGQTSVVATQEDQNNLAAVVGAGEAVNVPDGVTPFENLKSGVESSFEAFKSGFSQLNGGYQEARDQALSNEQ